MAAVVGGVLRALVHLHGLGIIHRDVKASNVLISADGDAKLGDLGVAAQLSPLLSHRSTFIGTPLYLSPEAIAAGSSDDSEEANVAQLSFTTSY